MTHTRANVIKRVEAEYKALDAVVRSLTPADWRKPAMREEAPIRFTAKDVLAHINAWKFRQARVTANDKSPLHVYEPPKTGALKDTNAGIYKRSHRTPAKTIVTEHRAGLDRYPLVVEVEVGAADGAGRDPNEGIVRPAERRLGDVLDPDRPGTLEGERLHPADSICSPLY